MEIYHGNIVYSESVKELKENGRDLSGLDENKIARIIGIAALKYGDLSNQASKDYVFDIERFASFEGNTGPYILYTMVRIKSLLKNNKIEKNDNNYLNKTKEKKNR